MKTPTEQLAEKYGYDLAANAAPEPSLHGTALTQSQMFWHMNFSEKLTAVTACERSEAVAIARHELEAWVIAHPYPKDL
jgi:hypothetical protein